ncbi:MAG: hypothetical protein F6K47_16095 [Symploca sp. SIO2E6]|nr:hypothetical protein [Symploca sp. SIO2E6]
MGIGNWELGIGNWELGIGNLPCSLLPPALQPPASCLLPPQKSTPRFKSTP